MEQERLRATIASARAGSNRAFEELMAAYGRRLYGYFYRATGRHHDAEDMLGEMMLRLVRMLRYYDDRGRFEPWLFRIAANMVRDRIRRLKASPSPVSLSAEDESGQWLEHQLPGDEPDADRRMHGEELSAELNAALEKLDFSTRQMVLMRHFGHMSFKEIADLFECPIGTVLAKVHRGLKALRESLGEEYGTD